MKPNLAQPEFQLSLYTQQGKALNTRATEVLYGGAAGGGKSHVMRVASIIWALQINGLQIYMFRRTFPELQKNHMTGPTSYPALLAPLVRSGFCRIVKNEIRFANGSRIFLQHCQHEADIDNFRGYEFHVLLIDELTLFTERMYAFLRSRVRLNDTIRAMIPAHLRGTFPRILCSSNPGGAGHHFVKQNWNIQQPDGPEPYDIWTPPEPDEDSVDAEFIDGEDEFAPFSRQYIPAKLIDNPSLNRRQYSAGLRGMGDELLVRAMLDGDWSVVAGAYWGPIWRAPLHICPPFDIPADWSIWRAADDGFSGSAHCTLWGTEDPNTGTIYVIAEVYGHGLLPEDVADRIIPTDENIICADEWGRPFRYGHVMEGIIDASAFDTTGIAAVKGTPTRKELSRGEAMNALGLNWVRCRKWPGCKEHGWQDIYRRLAPNPRCPDKLPGLRFFPACKNVISVLPAALRDPKKPEDIKEANDHPLDALRYLLQRTDPGIESFRVS